MVGGGPFNLKPGEWADVTSMTLCLAESILETAVSVAPISTANSRSFMLKVVNFDECVDTTNRVATC